MNTWPDLEGAARGEHGFETAVITGVLMVCRQCEGFQGCGTCSNVLPLQYCTAITSVRCSGDDSHCSESESALTGTVTQIFKNPPFSPARCSPGRNHWYSTLLYCRIKPASKRKPVAPTGQNVSFRDVFPKNFKIPANDTTTVVEERWNSKQYPSSRQQQLNIISRDGDANSHKPLR